MKKFSVKIRKPIEGYDPQSLRSFMCDTFGLCEMFNCKCRGGTEDACSDYDIDFGNAHLAVCTGAEWTSIAVVNYTPGHEFMDISLYIDESLLSGETMNQLWNGLADKSQISHVQTSWEPLGDPTDPLATKV